MRSNYELEIISHLAQFDGKVFKPWLVDGIDTIGVWGDEPFEFVFRNNTSQRVQIRLSLDGTDVLTGKEAHTAPTSDGTWVVDARGSMRLKAWPETDQRGHSFIFGKIGASVAAHTHGNMSNRGIIAAAVFTEGYISPPVPRFEQAYFQGGYSSYGTAFTNTFTGDSIIVDNTKGSSLSGLEIKNAPAIGAGEEVLQKIGTARGLITPKLSHIIKMRYVWEDDLQVSLVKQSVTPTDNFPSGFPGDYEKKLVDLGGTPTVRKVTQRPVQRFI